MYENSSIYSDSVFCCVWRRQLNSRGDAWTALSLPGEATRFLWTRLNMPLTWSEHCKLKFLVLHNSSRFDDCVIDCIAWLAFTSSLFKTYSLLLSCATYQISSFLSYRYWNGRRREQKQAKTYPTSRLPNSHKMNWEKLCRELEADGSVLFQMSQNRTNRACMHDRRLSPTKQFEW